MKLCKAEGLVASDAAHDRLFHLVNVMYMHLCKLIKFQVSGNASWKSGDQNRSGSPSESSGYLDAQLLDRLKSESGVQPVVIVQCLRDAVFVPASAFYQVSAVVIICRSNHALKDLTVYV